MIYSCTYEKRNKPNECEPCSKNYALCPHLHNTSKFSDSKGNVRNYVNCKSVNVVYGVLCEICNKNIYVGETGDALYQRHLLNLSLIRRKADDPVAHHFCTNNHAVEHFSVIGLVKLYQNKFYRNNRKNLWKEKLNTFKPYSINTKE